MRSLDRLASLSMSCHPRFRPDNGRVDAGENRRRRHPQPLLSPPRSHAIRSSTRSASRRSVCDVELARAVHRMVDRRDLDERLHRCQHGVLGRLRRDVHRPRAQEIRAGRGADGARAVRNAPGLDDGDLLGRLRLAHPAADPYRACFSWAFRSRGARRLFGPPAFRTRFCRRCGVDVGDRAQPLEERGDDLSDGSAPPSLSASRSARFADRDLPPRRHRGEGQPRLDWLAANLGRMLGEFALAFQFILYSVFGVGLLAAIKFWDNRRSRLPFFVALFGLCLLLPMTDDQTRVIAVVTFPLVLANWLFEPGFLASVSRRERRWRFSFG